MNERIKELITKCTWVLADEAGHKEVFDKEKFAQLLIRECAYFTDHLAYPDIIDKHMTSGEAILEYFGVKE